MHRTNIDKYINKNVKGLLILKEVKSIGKGVRVNCKCLACKKEKEFNLSSIIHTKGKNSCGCLKHALGNKSPRWQGYGEIGKSIFNAIKFGAEVRNLKFEISIQDMWNLFLEQNGKCALSGIKIWFPCDHDYTKCTASLDRIDSLQGYIKGNIQWVHRIVNFMKQKLNNEEFLEWVDKIYKYNHE